MLFLIPEMMGILKFLYFLRVGCPLCCHVYPGTLAASMCSMDVFEPGWPSSCVMDPRCFLCDLFLPLFSQQDRHFGIWYITTCLFALMLQFLICCGIYCISACAYVLWMRNSSCCVVFRFVRYAVGCVVLCCVVLCCVVLCCVVLFHER
jgi:hypothetical protein